MVKLTTGKSICSLIARTPWSIWPLGIPYVYYSHPLANLTTGNSICSLLPPLGKFDHREFHTLDTGTMVILMKFPPLLPSRIVSTEIRPLLVQGIKILQIPINVQVGWKSHLNLHFHQYYSKFTKNFYKFLKWNFFRLVWWWVKWET